MEEGNVRSKGWPLLCLGLSLVPLVVLLLLLSHLPEEVPLHFATEGMADGWVGRGMLVVLAISCALVGPLIYVLQERAARGDKIFYTRAIALVLLFGIDAGVLWVIAAAAGLVRGIVLIMDYDSLTFSMVGLVFVVLGLMAQRLLPNRFSGAREPGFYGLDRWRPLQGWLGVHLAFVGMATLLASLFFPGRISVAVFGTTALAAVISTFVYMVCH